MTSGARSLDETTLRAAYGQFPSGVVALCARVDDVPVGMAASSFVAVSIDPPLVAVCIQNTSTTWPKLQTVPHIGVSVLGDSHARAARTLAAKTGNRFDGLDVTTSATGSIFLDGAPMWLDTVIVDQVSAGDHLIVVLRIEDLEVRASVSPMVFHGSIFRRLEALTVE